MRPLSLPRWLFVVLQVLTGILCLAFWLAVFAAVGWKVGTLILVAIVLIGGLSGRLRGESKPQCQPALPKPSAEQLEILHGIRCMNEERWTELGSVEELISSGDFSAATEALKQLINKRPLRNDRNVDKLFDLLGR